MADPIENRGGNRPTAPQNNPFNVGAGGGSTQSGRASGYAYGVNKAINDQSSQGNAAVGALKAGGGQTPFTQVPLESMPNIMDPTAQPTTPITDGARVGPGLNTIPGLPAPTQPTDAQSNQSILNYAPVLKFIASKPTTSLSSIQVINSLLEAAQNAANETDNV